MRWVLAAALAGCTAQAAPPLSGGGSPPSSATGNAPTVDSTLAQCQALTPDEGDLCYPTDSPYTMVARVAGTWSYRYPGIGFDVTPPSSSGWTAENSASVTSVGGMRRLRLPAGTGVNYRMERRALPAASGYWVDACIVTAHGQVGERGMAWWQTSDDKFVVTATSEASGGSINYQNYTNVTTWSANVAQILGGPADRVFCMRLHDNATNRKLYIGSTTNASTTETSVWPQYGADVGRTTHITADAIAWGGYVGDADADQDLYLVHYATGTYTP